MMEVIIIYRKRKNSDTWHFCKNCNRWPRFNYVTSNSKPSSGELCNECKSKLKSNSCS